MIFFIGLNHNFSVEKDFNLKIGETKKIDSYEFFFKDLKLEQHNNYKAVIGKLQVSNLSTNEQRTLSPEIRIYSNPQTLTYEASIKTNFLRDYYLTMSNIDRSDYYNFKFQKTTLIGFDIVIMLSGGFKLD